MPNKVAMNTNRDDLIRTRLSQIESFTDNKLEDAIKLYNFLEQHNDGDITIEEIKSGYGGEALRVDAILFEMEQKGIVEITSRGFFGAPQKCRLNKTE